MWAQHHVRHVLQRAADVDWLCATIHLEAQEMLQWGVSTAPDPSTDMWRDEPWDGHWSEAWITAAGVVWLCERYGIPLP
jgi:hypothetical protein